MRALKSVFEWARRRRRLIAVCLVAGILAWLHGPVLASHVAFAFDPWHFADDVRVLIHPLFRVEDASVFPGDPSVEYFLRSLPDGYRLLYETFGRVAGVVLLSKLLPYLLLAVTLGCLAFAAGRISGAGAVLGTLSLGLGSAYLLGRMAGGLPRSFALALLSAGVAALVAGRVRGLALLVVIAAGFYPVAALLLGVTLARWLLLPWQERGDAAAWSLRRRVVTVVVAGLLAGLVLLPSVVRLREYGVAITPALWRAFPEAGPGGRFDAVDRPPFPPLPEAAESPLVATLVGAGRPLVPGMNQADHGATFVMLLFALALIAWVLLARRRPEAQRMLSFLAAVTLCHALALVSGLRLFIPERYVAYGIPVLALVVVPAALGACTRAVRPAVQLVPVLYNLALLALLGARGSSWTGITVAIPPAEFALYDAIRTLPRSAVIAGFPGEAIDNVPYLTRRAAFITRETQMPFHAQYTRLERERTRALIQGYFAVSNDALRAFRERTHVTHLLVDRRHFATRPTYFAPFDPDVARAFDDMKRSGSAVLAGIPRARTFEVGPFVLLDLAKL